MSVSDTIRLLPFWRDLKARLDSARMRAILGGPGRVYLSTDDYGEDEGAQNVAWGRLVILDSRTLWPGMDGEALWWPFGFTLRAEVHDPGGQYDPVLALEAAQDEAYKLIDQWLPAPYPAAMIAEPIQRWVRPTALPLWDRDRGLWYNSAGYRTKAAPAPPA